MRFDKIIEVVSNVLGLDITENTRQIDVIFGRALYYHICRNYYDGVKMVAKADNSVSYHRIGSAIKRDHATVMNGLKVWDNELSKFTKWQDNKEKCLTILFNIEVDDSVLFKDKIEEIINVYEWKMEKLKKHHQEEIEKIKGNYKNENTSSIMFELLNLNDSEILEFYETRLKPFKMLLKSRKQPKNIVKVQGALISR